MAVIKRFSGIDEARALAAISVVLAHFLGPKLPDGLKYLFTGHPAVIAFFVISGFCIHWPFAGKQLPVSAFLFARWTRILIPAFAALILAKYLEIQGFNFVDGYILWSLVCEAIYYTLYPLIHYVSKRISFTTLVLISFLASYSVVFWLGTDQFGNSQVYGPSLNWVVSMPAWLMGCWLADTIFESKSKSAKKLLVSIWITRLCIGVLASVCYWATFNTIFGFYITMNLFAIPATFWIYQETLRNPKCRFGTLAWIGNWSFSIYLFHVIAIVGLSKLYLFDKIDAYLRIPVVLTLIFSICYILYQIFERPTHQLARKIFKKFSGIKGGSRDL